MYVFHELRDRLMRWLGQGRLKNTKVRRYLLGGMFFALLTAILATWLAPPRPELKVDDLAPADLVAPRDIENRLATQRRRENAANAIPMQRKTDPEVQKQAEEFVVGVFRDIRIVRDMPNQDEKTRVDTLMSRISLANTLPPETYGSLLKLDDKTLEAGQQDAIILIRAALTSVVEAKDVAEIRAKIDQDVPGYNSVTTDPRYLRSFIKELVKSRIRSNQTDDPETTQQLRAQASAAQPSVIIRKGECCIVENHKPVTQEQYVMLKDLGLIGTRADFRSLTGTALLSFVFVALMGLYLVRYRPDILEKDSKLLLLGIIGLMTLLLSLMMRTFQDSLGPGVGYLMPVAINAMLVTILVDPKLALLQSGLLAMLSGMATEVNQLNHAIVAMVGSVVGMYAVAKVESRTDIYRAGALVAGANAATIVAFYLMQAVSVIDLQMWKDAGLGAANGLMTAILVTGALPLFENTFGVLTPLKLLELSNPNHLLLKKLLVEAPGSYHHTILVANLCEAAAEAVGADQVLSRVGAYYHDIGKAKRPYFFVENQFGGENPHDKLPPSLSALIITSHVKDGLEMAREARLPQEIIDFIPEHHGTMLVSYFFHMANKNGQSEFVLEDDFRYDGPKPHRKETGICMLADGCEASVRAMRQKGHLTVDQIEAQVKRIVEDRLAQGQLDNCDLTLRELDIIQKTFVKMLSGVHHARIEYPPEAMTGRIPGAAADGSVEVTSDANVDQQRSGEDTPDRGSGGDHPPGDAAGA